MLQRTALVIPHALKMFLHSLGMITSVRVVCAFFPDDVLCTSTSTCCQLNNPPWFTKNFPTAVSDDIELWLCTNSGPAIDDVPIELIEL